MRLSRWHRHVVEDVVEQCQQQGRDRQDEGDGSWVAFQLGSDPGRRREWVLTVFHSGLMTLLHHFCSLIRARKASSGVLVPVRCWI